MWVVTICKIIIAFRYASRVKLITNDASKNADNKEIARLKGVSTTRQSNYVLADTEDSSWRANDICTIYNKSCVSALCVIRARAPWENFQEILLLSRFPVWDNFVRIDTKSCTSDNLEVEKRRKLGWRRWSLTSLINKSGVTDGNFIIAFFVMFCLKNHTLWKVNKGRGSLTR